ncbi:MAG: 2-oxo acid dehydrogenase subunit E2 [Firmicutes bacterium]|nr:2-oxo acid dehydrogenase subunit E2 [Alicyclobacillaceae bacterium]MCL6496524.1 2-oxo acid dehydrogenase subunit E2 [Bacillota bacterium]
MAEAIRVPRLGLGSGGGRIAAWHRRAGDAVTPGAVLLELETDKATIEVTAEQAGILTGVVGAEGEWVEEGAVLGWIVQPGEAPPQAEERPNPPAGRPDPQAPREPSGPRVRASPYARRLGRELGVDLREVKGSGPGGRVVARDVEQAAQSRRTQRMRAAVARVTAEGAAVPSFWAARRVEMASVRALLEREGAPRGVGWTDCLLQALVLGIAQTPALARARRQPAVQVGLAVAVPGGLVLPVLSVEPRTGLAALAQARRGLVERARAGRLLPQDVGSPEVILSNLGGMGVDRFLALLAPGTFLALAAGRVQEGVAVTQGAMRATWWAEFTVTVDHRVADGADAARFLDVVAQYFETGQGLHWE